MATTVKGGLYATQDGRWVDAEGVELSKEDARERRKALGEIQNESVAANERLQALFADTDPALVPPAGAVVAPPVEAPAATGATESGNGRQAMGSKK